MALAYSSIYEASLSCRERLQECVAQPALMTDEWARKRLADFNLWAAGSGALARAHASLDEQLSEKETVRSVLIDLLGLLEALTRRCLQTVGHSDYVDDKYADSSSDEKEPALTEIFADTEAVITKLVRISIAIRRSGAQAHRDRADGSYVSDIYDELRDHLGFLISVWATKSERENGSTRYPEYASYRLNEVQKRLIESNTRRRHRFLFARRRGVKRGKERDDFTTDERQVRGLQIRQPSTCQEVGNAVNLPTTEGAAQSPHILSHFAAATIAASSVPTAIQNPINLALTSQASMTAPSSISSKVVYPKPPKVKEGQEIFRCPCCLQTLPLATGMGLRWKKHLTQDIMPYTCVLSSCERPEKLYDTRKEWLKHMSEEHNQWQYWLCSACLEPKRFDVEQLYVEHLLREHANDISADQIEAVVSMSASNAPLHLEQCPLCPESSAGDPEVDPEAMLMPRPDMASKEREYLGIQSEHLAADYFAVSSKAESSNQWGDSPGSEDSRIDAEGMPDLVFQDQNPEETISKIASFVCGKPGARRVFAVLACLSRPERIDLFYEHNFVDSILPLFIDKGRQVKTRSAEPGHSEITKRVFADKFWAFVISPYLFCDNQWQFLAPVFNEHQFRYSFRKEHRMPFLEQPGGHRESHFSTVGKWSIHQSHFEKSSKLRLSVDTNGHPIVAVKELRNVSMNDAEYHAAAEAEAGVLEMIREMKHPHLIKAIAYYKRGDRYFIIFPWAGGGNLRDYWGREPPRKLDADFVGWALDQLCGLASAINKLHSTKDSACRHGDLKPENILCFENTRSSDPFSQPFLVIADVGLAKVHILATEMRNEATRTMNGTVMYEPPEAVLLLTKKLPRSRRYDVWSIGCIYFEFLIWLLYGKAELLRFGDDITHPVNRTRQFFDVHGSGVTGAASIKPGVQKWMDWIRRDPRCPPNTAIRKLLDLICTRLLVIEVSKLMRKESSGSDSAQGSATLHATDGPDTPSIVRSDANSSLQGDTADDLRYRATSIEMYETLAGIVKDASGKPPRIAWMNWQASSPGGLGQRGGTLNIPQLVLDAINVTRNLGIGYLWIDALYIVQDDPEDWKMESLLMEQVYSSAYATFAASCASGTEDGFLKPRPWRQCLTLASNRGSYYICESIDDFGRDVEQGELNKRAWILQERPLSAAQSISRKSRRTGNVEEARKASFLDSDFSHSIDTYVRGMKIELYQDLYQKYSGLALSSIGDRPVAIRGLEARLIRTFRTVGSHGVFDTFLHRCLLWKKASRSLNRIESELLRGVYVPSWSWMAYDGEIKYLNVPFNKYSWEADIISPFRTWSSQSMKERGEKEGVCEIKGPVWDFRGCDSLKLELDNPDRKLSNLRCVIVARRKDLQGDPQQSHYIIVVHSVAVDGLCEIYERVGVAEVRGEQIAFNKGSQSGILR
ncbi:protein kinase domain-containing protein [Colletotrichum melonis]|uniref:Protein kinase domain-containing protein n=1 Tax=Colletotrichum melonis TaxID=1209925 RepID=A0AAI9XH37_9PEZI|nr:protein kinase domain-containing protein [Colletotrichum melonis]